MEIVLKEPLMLLFLLIIPLIIFLHYYFFEHIKRKAMKFSNFSAMKRVTGTTLITKNNSQLILRIIVFFVFIMAMSKPVIWLEKDASVTNFVIAIDSSASMLSDDVLPDRLTIAKEAASSFVDSINAYSKIGVISFAGVSFIRTALSDNKARVKEVIKDIEIELAGGTDIGGALITAVNILSITEEEKSKTVILITDGSDTAGIFIEENIENAIDYLLKNHVIVHTIGIGTEIGKSYIENLNPIYDKETLKRIAEATGGNFYEVKSTSEIVNAFKDIEIKKEKAKVPYEMKNSLLIIGFILLLFEWYLMNTKFRALP